MTLPGWQATGMPTNHTDDGPPQNVAEGVERALAAHASAPDDERETQIADMLIDLRHYCAQHGLSFLKLSEDALRHWTAESGYVRTRKHGTIDVVADTGEPCTLVIDLGLGHTFSFDIAGEALVRQGWPLTITADERVLNYTGMKQARELRDYLDALIAYDESGQLAKHGD